MQRTCIVVVDATRARFFTYDRSVEAEGISEVMSERTDLVNPQRRKTPHELFTDSRPGSSRVAGRGFAFNDHRDAHMDHIDAEFARDIAAAIDRTVRAHGATRLIICASPRMLGALRAAEFRREGLVIDEMRRDFSKLTPTQIQDRLVGHGLLPPPPTRPGLAGRA